MAKKDEMNPKCGPNMPMKMPEKGTKCPPPDMPMKKSPMDVALEQFNACKKPKES